MKKNPARPFVFVNVAMTADGKIAPANRHFEPFAGKRDQRHLLELRATADAVMSGAHTINANPITLGPGGARYRRQRLQRGLAEYNLRIVVSGSGSVDPDAEIFKHHFSPIIVLTTSRIAKARIAKLRALGAEVKIFGAKELDFSGALRWLRAGWKVKRLLCEGGGEVNAALFREDLVDEIHLTISPSILGGRGAPTLADGTGVARLADAARFQLATAKRHDDEMFLVYGRDR